MIPDIWMYHSCRKYKILPIALKETNVIFVFLENYFYRTQFPLDSCWLNSVWFGKQRRRSRPQPEGWPQACNLSVSTLWVEMTKKIIHGDIENQVVKSFICVFVGFCLLCLDSETMDFPFMCLHLKLKETFPHIFVTTKSTHSLSCNFHYCFIVLSFEQFVINFSRPTK